MNIVSQEQMDDLVSRLRGLVKLYGGQSPELAKAKMLYKWLEKRVEHATFGILLAEIQRLEAESMKPTMKFDKNLSRVL